jgi:hypothetical protein
VHLGKIVIMRLRRKLTAIFARALRQCMTYRDLSMVRDGVVTHPAPWEFCGYKEIQNPKTRKGILSNRVIGCQPAASVFLAVGFR